jgi:glycosyltransferase involved in cell wall biosynthesis
MYSCKKILHLIETVGPGGAETVFADILEYMKYNDTENEHIAGFIKNGWIYNYVKNRKHPVVLFKTGNSIDINLIKNIVKYIKEHKVSIVHSHLPDLSFYSSIAARIAGVPHIMTEHGDASNTTLDWHRLFLKYFLISFLSNRIICVSQYNKRILKKRLPWLRGKISIIYNGIEKRQEDGKNFRKSIRTELKIERDEIAICNLANLYPVKGQINLLKAFKIVMARCPKTKLFIIGRGNLEKQLKEKASLYDIEKKVMFLGFREDAKKILYGMDIFVLPSISEGLPISIIEAMRAGLPVVATNVGGIPEFKKLGGDVILVSKNEIEKLAESIISVAQRKSFKSKLNIEIYEKYFNANTMSSQYIDEYKKLI